MATTVGQHSVSTFATPVNGGPLDANVVRGNDNTIRSAYVAHDADTGIHVQSSTLATRPAAGTAGRKWITADTGIFKLWYDDGTTWHEVGTSTIDVYVLADENLVKGDIIKVTGYNVGNGAPRVAKVSSASDVAFGIVNGTIASGAVGYVTNTGLIIDLNTNSFAIGDILYPNTSGGLTTTKPTSGNYQPVAFVLRSNSNNGVLYVEFSAPRIVERSDNTASTVVLRDASGNFSAGTITAGALTSTGLVTFASLKGTGSTTVTDILNDGTMATASATTLATSASIKTYVDNQIGANNELSEVLANGNTTGLHDIIVTSGQKITTNTIAETSSGVGVTIDSVLLKDNEVTATGVRVTDIKANNGTAAGSISTAGVVTLGSSVLTTTDINGGTVDGTTIGASVPAAATFTNITSAGTINLTGATVSNGGSVTTIDINGGTIDGTTIGGASPAAGTFTTINATDINATTFDMTNLEVTNIKAKDGTASMTIANTSGDVTVSAAFIANGNVTLGSDTADSITVNGIFPTGTKLRTGLGTGNTLAISGYTGTSYVDLITATAATSPTLTLTSTGVGSMNNIAIGGSTAAAGSFTTLSASGNFTLGADVVLSRGAANRLDLASGDSMNVVAGDYQIGGTSVLSSSTLGSGVTASSLTSVGTLTSLTVSGDLTVDTSTLKVDSANNRVGIGTASPAYLLDLTNATDSGERGARIQNDSVQLYVGVEGSSGNRFIGSAINNAFFGTTGADGIELATNNTVRATLDSSGNLAVDTNTLYVDAANNAVGIGTATPGTTYQLTVRRDGADTGVRIGNNTTYDQFIYFNGNNDWSMGMDYSNSNAFVISNSSTLGTNDRVVLTTSGNLGLGVTPSAWGSGWVAAQLSGGGAAIAGRSTNPEVYLTANAHYDGTNWKYKTTNTAGYYAIDTGQHRFYTAASGTAGNNISFGDPKMTLDGSGNLLVGTTGLYHSAKLTVGGKQFFSEGTNSDIGGCIYGYVNSAYQTYAGGLKFQVFRSDGSSYQMFDAMTLDASGNLGVGTTSPNLSGGATGSQIVTVSASASGRNGILELNGTRTTSGDYVGYVRFFNNAGATPLADIQAIRGSSDTTGVLAFATGNTERARITSGGILGVGVTNPTGSTADAEGMQITPTYILANRSAGAGIGVNRKTNDGDLVIFYQADDLEGSISVSGNTVSYNAFAGSHWSQLEDGSKPEILRGTVMEALNELCEWPNEQNERLPKAKVSDTAGSKKVYGVFMAWDNDWTVTNDMYVTAVGAFICRIAADVVVEQGDLLESNGDGTARVQADDVIRSSTIGKVTSTVKTHEYEDGTYCVPTVLYCG